MVKNNWFGLALLFVILAIEISLCFTVGGIIPIACTLIIIGCIIFHVAVTMRM